MRKTVHKLEKVMKPIYKRILLKLSGEGLMGDKNFGMSAEVIQRLAGQIKEVHDNGVQICLVIGGGNIFRGAKEAVNGMNRTVADQIGMLATVMNALSMQNALEKIGVSVRVMKLVIVESPAKAKTINKYLGSDYKVLASFGHIRDLPSKDGSVNPDEDFAMTWELSPGGKNRLNDIIAAVKDADTIVLASDPDREGEAIAWHILEELTARKKIKDKKIERVVFHEITKSAVTEAIKNPRQIDNNLVSAYMARRALDYLVGFTLSPVLWRKLPGSKSAGRVQSVALRLICDRETEIEKFKAEEYWTVDADLITKTQALIKTRLITLDGKKLEKFDLNTEAKALDAKAKIEAQDFAVSNVERKKTNRYPAPPSSFFHSISPLEISSRYSSSWAVKSYSTYFLKKFSRKTVTMRPRSSGMKRNFSTRTYLRSCKTAIIEA
jgi:hypothetical protein